MRDVVLEGGPASLPRIAPVVLGDELLQTALPRLFGKFCGLSKDPAPLAVHPPLILHTIPRPVRCNLVPHRKTHIIFAIEHASGGRNRAFGHDLGDEYNSYSLFASRFSPDVESQIHFIKIRMKRNREAPEQLGAAELKTDEADVRFALERIQ